MPCSMVNLWSDFQCCHLQWRGNSFHTEGKVWNASALYVCWNLPCRQSKDRLWLLLKKKKNLLFQQFSSVAFHWIKDRPTLGCRRNWAMNTRQAPCCVVCLSWGCSLISGCSLDLPVPLVSLGDHARALHMGLQTPTPRQAKTHRLKKARFHSLPHVHAKSLVCALKSRNMEKNIKSWIHCYCLHGSR